MTEKFSLKDHLFNATKLEQLAKEIHRTYPSFKRTRFVRDALEKFPELELKARIAWIAECLRLHLPSDYREAVTIILSALPPPNNPNLSDDDFGEFIYAPYLDFVAKWGCNRNQLEFSLQAIYQLTQRFSAEDAIRYFLNAFPEETLAKLAIWSKDSHYHVRRLASEGTRPKLPWSQKINIPITAPIAILDQLFADSTRYVVRSVANHLNDIAKTDAALVIKTLKRWKKSNRQTSKEMDYLIRHSLRTLIKNGNSDALALLGVSQAADVQMSNLRLSQQVSMGSTLEFSFDILAKEDAEVIADYVVYFNNKSGKADSRKVFKLKQLSLRKGEHLTLQKKHLMRENMSTRQLYRGQQAIEIQINGKCHGKAEFYLV